MNDNQILMKVQDWVFSLPYKNRLCQSKKYLQQLVFLSVFLVLFITASGHTASFDYKHDELILDHYTKLNVSIEGVLVTAVDYSALAKEAEKQNSDYSTLLKDLASFNPETLGSQEEKMAFWISVYNIAAIKTIVDHYPVDSIRSRKINWLGFPWNSKIITTGGKEYAPGQIGNDILLDTFKDLRIHFAIHRASVSCINLAQEPYRGPTLSKQPEEQGKRFLAGQQKGFRIDREKNIIYLSQVFKFDKKHFSSLGAGRFHFVLPFLSPEDREFIKIEKFTKMVPNSPPCGRGASVWNISITIGNPVASRMLIKLTREEE